MLKPRHFPVFNPPKSLKRNILNKIRRKKNYTKHIAVGVIGLSIVGYVVAQKVVKPALVKAEEKKAIDAKTLLQTKLQELDTLLDLALLDHA